MTVTILRIGADALLKAETWAPCSAQLTKQYPLAWVAVTVSQPRRHVSAVRRLRYFVAWRQTALIRCLAVGHCAPSLLRQAKRERELEFAGRDVLVDLLDLAPHANGPRLITRYDRVHVCIERVARTECHLVPQHTRAEVWLPLLRTVRRQLRRVRKQV